MPSSPAYLDPATGATYPIETPRWRSETGGPLMITDLPGIGRAEIDTGRRSLWRYAAALPVAVADPVTLGEGCTPLVRRPWRGGHAHFKLEWFAPSGSFKDRGAAVMLSILRQQGIDAVLEDSSGNGGAAVATYAAAAGMRAKILVPASTSPAKTVQMRAVGAEVELIPGSRQDTADAAVRQADSIFYASHNWQAHFLQGTKTLAYELWEDLGFRAPDNVIIPCGAGSNILGCDIGFSELLRRGEIARLPRLYAVQPAHCAPLHAGFEAGAEDFVPVTPRPTLAEGASIAQPVRGREVLAALRRSGGGTVAVSEDAIEAALMELARSGLYVEPTCAMAAAALTDLTARGAIRPEETTVVVLTGTGIKATPRIAELLGLAP
ncbi:MULTISPECIES: pyridoxal-phosphate dependent enzyme [Methylobacterium]|uniref:pyridoxal-phosphate dependent enzyme n=1 Tax=Methylobacterium TaxID=407 RepID=UPI00036288C2|nr:MULTISPECIES: pyridoxal-phosphate dependent enzyme [Methylobacterium]MBN4095084.1 pyridoxal-phosphate dependent enzyme [Methylobacterium sp. OT2]UIN32538.1 pyridoxal-phosphate dependent enzyme [Methylobacterium oryzae]